MPSFAASGAVVPRLIVLDQAGSTNDELEALAAHERLAPYTAMVTTNQTAGRGRRDRSWSTPPGRGLAISLLLPETDRWALPWLPLVAGLAMRDAVAQVIPDAAPAALKWPNDVMIRGRKASGVLGRLLADGRVVMGAGVNLRIAPDELPVPTATSLTIEGADEEGLDDRVLSAYLRGISSAVMEIAERRVTAESVARRVDAACDTIGRDVRVELPAGDALVGRAVGIGPDARLMVRREGGGVEMVAAGDVVHLRATD